MNFDLMHPFGVAAELVSIFTAVRMQCTRAMGWVPFNLDPMSVESPYPNSILTVETF